MSNKLKLWQKIALAFLIAVFVAVLVTVMEAFPIVGNIIVFLLVTLMAFLLIELYDNNR